MQVTSGGETNQEENGRSRNELWTNEQANRKIELEQLEQSDLPTQHISKQRQLANFLHDLIQNNMFHCCHDLCRGPWNYFTAVCHCSNSMAHQSNLILAREI